jgi:hypothetical protein
MGGIIAQSPVLRQGSLPGCRPTVSQSHRRPEHLAEGQDASI